MPTTPTCMFNRPFLQNLNRKKVMYKVPHKTLYSSPPPFFKSWFSSPKFLLLSPLSHLIFLPTALILYIRWFYFPFSFLQGCIVYLIRNFIQHWKKRGSTLSIYSVSPRIWSSTAGNIPALANLANSWRYCPAISLYTTYTPTNS